MRLERSNPRLDGLAVILGKARSPEEFSTRLLLRIPSTQKNKKHHARWCFLFYGAPEPVSEQKIIDNCFLERCPTKQGVTRAADLRRRRATTMRLGRSNPGPTAYRLRYIASFVVFDRQIAN